MRKLLLTGFEPYSSTIVNPAEEVAKALDKQIINQVSVTSTIVPNTFFKAINHVRSEMLKDDYDFVLMMGEYTGRAMVTLERYAHRLIDAYRYQLHDNDGISYSNKQTVENGPVAYQTHLPIKRIVEAIRADGIPADISDTAGTFVCNHLFYGILHEIHEQNHAIKAGWVHLPMLPGTAAQKEYLGMPSMCLDSQINAIKATIDVLASHDTDIDKSISAGLQI